MQSKAKSSLHRNAWVCNPSKKNPWKPIDTTSFDAESLNIYATGIVIDPVFCKAFLKKKWIFSASLSFYIYSRQWLWFDQHVSSEHYYYVVFAVYCLHASRVLHLNPVKVLYLLLLLLSLRSPSFYSPLFVPN